MFKKVWASNWSKVLFAQVVAAVFTVSVFFGLIYGSHMTNSVNIICMTAGVSTFALLLTSFVGLVKKSFFLVFVLNEAIFRAAISVSAAVMLTPLIFDEEPVIATVAAIVILIPMLVGSVTKLAQTYDLSRRLVRVSFWAESLVVLAFFYCYSHTSLLPASL